MIDDPSQPGGSESPGEASSVGAAMAPLPPVETLATMTLAQVLATPVGDLVRMLFEGAPARPRPASMPTKVDIEAARERGRQEARERAQRVRRGRV